MPSLLQSEKSLGGKEGDRITNTDLEIAHVFSDGVYGFKRSESALKLDLDAAIARVATLEADLKKRLPDVVSNHKPTDAETNGSWGWWISQIPSPPDKVRINFHRWMGGQYSYALLRDEDEIEIPWEALAQYDPARQTYTIPIEGLSVEYNKTPIAVLENQHFSPPALIFRFKDADKVFSTISWKAQNLNGTEIGNGSSAAAAGEKLTVIQVNPAMAGSESTVVTKVIFEFTRLNGSKLPYEVKI